MSCVLLVIDETRECAKFSFIHTIIGIVVADLMMVVAIVIIEILLMLERFEQQVQSKFNNITN